MSGEECRSGFFFDVGRDFFRRHVEDDGHLVFEEGRQCFQKTAVEVRERLVQALPFLAIVDESHDDLEDVVAVSRSDDILEARLSLVGA